MRHLIERVLELAEEEEGPTIRPTSVEEMDSNDAELKRLLESLQPRIRVYGAGGAGCNAVSRLHEEGLFENRYVTGHAINTDAQELQPRLFLVRLQHPIQSLLHQSRN